MDAAVGYEELKSKVAKLPPDPGAGLLIVRGAEAEKYLQAMLTQQVQGLEPGQGREAAVLDREGRILAGFVLFRRTEGFLLRVEEGRTAVLKAHFEKFRIAAKVEFLLPEPVLEMLGCGGPEAAGFLAATLKLEPLPQTSPALIEWPDSGFLIRWDRFGFPLWEAWLSDARLKTLDKGLTCPGASPEAVLAHRIESLRPFLHSDIKGFIPNDLPLLDTMVSFSKGCFPGQEVVVRIKHRGQPGHRLALLKVEQGSPPVAGTPLMHEGQEAGSVMAAAYCPSIPGQGLMALLRRVPGKVGSKLSWSAGSGLVVK